MLEKALLLHVAACQKFANLLQIRPIMSLTYPRDVFSFSLSSWTARNTTEIRRQTEQG
jgi:hypothetical protein